MSSRFRFDLEKWCDDFFGEQKQFGKRKTFGCPAYYFGKKMVVFCYQDGIGIKLPPERVLEKITENTEIYSPFNPGDGVMKNWLIITHAETEEYEREIPLFEESLSYFS